MRNHVIESGDRSRGRRPLSPYHPKETPPFHVSFDAIQNEAIRKITPARQRELGTVIQEIFATLPPDDPKNFTQIFEEFDTCLNGPQSTPEYLYCTRAFSDFVFNQLRAKMADVIAQFVSYTPTDEKELLTSYEKSSGNINSLASPFKKIFRKLKSPTRVINIQNFRNKFGDQLSQAFQKKKLDLTH